jgi:iron complex transport system permease protein
MNGRAKLFFLVMALALCVVGMISLFCGLIPVDPVHFFTGTLTMEERTVLFVLRLPRLLFGVLTGAALALSGAVLQGVFGNPLADPGLLGVSSGASLGAVVMLLSGLPFFGSFFLPLGAFIGSLGAVLAVGMLGRHSFNSFSISLLLGGVAVSLFCSALTTGLLSFAPPSVMQQYFFWTLGSLGGTSWHQALLGIPLIALLVLLSLWGRQLNVLSLGDEQALSVGMDVRRWRFLILTAAALLTSLAVCLGGNIGFVGLLVPHMCRFVVGADHRRLLPCSAIAGAFFLVLCDLAGRLFPFGELRTGVVTALVGAPYFLFLLYRFGRKRKI